ncbi:SEFIR domain-containing protein [Aliinostoc sp. HNIBRCY26]|uniref:SEFIR domain-containing protein n=1 Tax=Aliinostoc sp. HNIBRCY26 TaxID=3418997 RepID=UPI003CFC1816
MNTNETINNDSDAPKVFISYSHDSQEHKDRVLIFSNRLRAEGIDCNIDQYRESLDEGWPRWMRNQLEWADFVLVVCTENYYRRFWGQEVSGKGQGVTWEGAIILQELYETYQKTNKFIPVLFPDGESKNIPEILRSFSGYRLEINEEYEKLYRLITNQPAAQKPPLGKVVDLPPRPLPPLPPRERQQTFEEIDSENPNPGTAQNIHQDIRNNSGFVNGINYGNQTINY